MPQAVKSLGEVRLKQLKTFSWPKSLCHFSVVQPGNAKHFYLLKYTFIFYDYAIKNITLKLHKHL